jgi:hypothetical protein
VAINNRPVIITKFSWNASILNKKHEIGMFNTKATLPQINNPRYLAKIICIGLNEVSNISNVPSSSSVLKKLAAIPIKESGIEMTAKIIPKLAILSCELTIVMLPLQNTKKIKKYLVKLHILFCSKNSCFIKCTIKN